MEIIKYWGRRGSKMREMTTERGQEVKKRIGTSRHALAC